jgi:hypothetical protein
MWLARSLEVTALPATDAKHLLMREGGLTIPADTVEMIPFRAVELSATDRWTHRESIARHSVWIWIAMSWKSVQVPPNPHIIIIFDIQMY